MLRSGTKGPSAPPHAATPRPRLEVLYVPVLATAMGLMMLRILLIARLLDVPGFALYSAGLLISTTFCMLGCVGLHPLLQRDMPILMARGRHRRALVRMTQAMLVACGCAVLGITASALRLTSATVSPALLAVGLVHGLSQQLFLVATVESRSRGEALAYSRQNLLRALLVVAVSAGTALIFGSPAAALLAEAGISLVLAAAILARAGDRERVSILLLLRAANRTWRQIPWPTAWVFLALSVAASTVFYLDRWLSASLLTNADFALYAFAGVTVLVAQSVQSMANASVYPLLARRFALSGEKAAYVLSARVSLAFLAVAAIAAVPTYTLTIAAIGHWYPQYQGANAVLVLLFAVSVLRVSDFWSSFLAICGYERRLLALHLCVALAVCAIWALRMQASGWQDAKPADFAWLALLLAAGSYAGAAAAATIAQRAVRMGVSTSARPR
jgi:O-antigen/teichoic acid export membrane protein